MFTGIIEDTGQVQRVVKNKNLTVLSIKSAKVARGIGLGDSVAINGVCLTVTSHKAAVLDFDVMKASLDATTLGLLKKGDVVNLERALKASGRFDGHFVTGHVDAVAKIKNVISKENYLEIKISLSKKLMTYMVEKGSVCVDGVSLTVGQLTATTISVYLIPFTKDVTTLGSKRVGDFVNIETDILAKYVLKNQLG